MASPSRRLAFRFDRGDIVIVALVIALILVGLFFWRVPASITAKLWVERVSFRYVTASAGTAAPAVAASEPFIKDFSEVTFPAARLEGDRSPARDLVLQALRPDSRIILSGGEVALTPPAEPAEFVVSTTEDTDGTHLSLRIAGPGTRVSVSMPGTAVVECHYCAWKDDRAGLPPLLPVATLRIGGSASTRADVSGGPDGLSLDTRIARPFVWGKFAGMDFRFLDDRPVEPQSSVASASTITVNGFGAQKITPVEKGQAVELITTGPLRVVDLQLSTGKPLYLQLEGDVDAITAGSTTRRYTMFDTMTASSWWIAVGVGLAFITALLTLVEKLKVRVEPAAESKP